MRDSVLDVRNLHTRFETSHGIVHAVRGVSFSLGPSEALALVGESGSGKSVSILSIAGLLEEARVEGSALLDSQDLLGMSRDDLRKVRGRGIAIVFQDPSAALNPVLSVGTQVCEGMREHLGLSRAAARRRALHLLDLVGIPGGEGRLRRFPHEFSGGQRQRLMIALALSCEPMVLVADEPTTGLDVTVQAQIVDLLARLRAELGMAVLWITHDLALVAGLVDRVAVMYAGRIVELGPVRPLFRRPRHPYTLGLLRAMPRNLEEGPRRLEAIPGSPPRPEEAFLGCPFARRCAFAVERCHTEEPPLLDLGGGEFSACWRSEEL